MIHPACRLDRVSVRYGATTAVDDVTLEVPAGQTVALVGPSGAGKTTLLRVLAGLERPTSGTVTVHGTDISALPPGPRRTALVGMAHQRFDLVPQLNVRHNVQAGLLGRWSLLRSLAALVLPIEVDAARGALARVGLDGLADQRTARLSGGEQQRVALARLLVQDPRVVLADEPVSALDPTRADDLLALLTGLAADGRTLVVSLHTPEHARRHVDRIVGVRGGRVVFDRPAPEVTDDLLAEVYQLEVT